MLSWDVNIMIPNFPQDLEHESSFTAYTSDEQPAARGSFHTRCTCAAPSKCTLLIGKRSCS